MHSNSIEVPRSFTVSSAIAGPFLSALISLHTIGIHGFRVYLAKLIENALDIRRLLEQSLDVVVQDPYGLGFVVMVRLYPPKVSSENMRRQELICVHGKYHIKNQDWYTSKIRDIPMYDTEVP